MKDIERTHHIKGSKVASNVVPKPMNESLACFFLFLDIHVHCIITLGSDSSEVVQEMLKQLLYSPLAPPLGSRVNC